MTASHNTDNFINQNPLRGLVGTYRKCPRIVCRARRGVASTVRRCLDYMNGSKPSPKESLKILGWTATSRVRLSSQIEMSGS